MGVVGGKKLIFFADTTVNIDPDAETDLAMPVMDGPATIHALRAIDPDVKIIASSGHTVTDAAGKALAAGVQNFIAKPYAAETMLRALQELLGKG